VNDAEVLKELAYLDGRTSADEHKAIAKLEALWVNVPNLLIKRYRVSRRWSDRASCVNHCTKYAKSNENAYQIGLIALYGKSKTVRSRACKLLSAAQKREAIEYLENLLSD